MTRRATVEVLEHQRENASAQWAPVFDLRASCPVTLGRQLFAGSPQSQAISRKQLELSFDGRKVVARTVGARCSFTLDPDGRTMPLPKGAVVQVAEGMILCFDKAHSHCLRVRTRLPQRIDARGLGSDARGFCSDIDARGLGSDARGFCSDDGSYSKHCVIDLEPRPPPLCAISPSGARLTPAVEPEPEPTATASAPDARGMLPGESEARRLGARRHWMMRPTRSIDDDGPHEAHLRTAEAVFGRAGGRAESIVSVEYHLNPELEARWLAKRAEYDRQYGRGGHTILYAFHGTPESNVEPILRGGFDLSHVGSTTCQGLYGAAIYLSELARHAALYNGGSNRLIVCKVLVGRPFVSYLVEGRSLEPGFTSHVSGPDATHLAIFDVAAALPLYVLNLRDEAAVFTRPLAGLQLAQPLAGMAGTGGFPPMAQRKRRAGGP